MKDVIFQSAKNQIKLLHSKQISSHELTKAYLDRIEKYDEELNSFLYINKKNALESAKKKDESISRNDFKGELFGLPIAIKDLTPINGMPTTSGSLLHKNDVANSDNLLFERIKQHGPIILGKTNTPEFGLMGHTENLLKGHCRNPWDSNKTSGGSSGGAGSAVAAGFCSIAMGGDAGGSIRIPSSYNGIFGIKPTQGRIPRRGFPVYNLIAQDGPMTRYVEDSALILEIISGFSSEDSSSINKPPIKFENKFWEYSLNEYFQNIHGKKQLNIAWIDNFGYAMPNDDIRTQCLNTINFLEKEGHTINPIKFDLHDIFKAWFNIFSVGTYMGGHKEDYKNHRDKFAWYTQEAFDNAISLSATEYADSILKLKEVQLKFSTLFQKYDMIASPTMPTTAFEVGHPPQIINDEKVHPSWGFCLYSYPVNLAGTPAVNIPTGFDNNGMPIGLQIIAPWEQEKELIKISQYLESIIDWPSQIPKKYQV
tara:strand:- start:59315 stop:60760 length:1446 start_codon:yes stop_codon:yes gene_type:complete